MNDNLVEKERSTEKVEISVYLDAEVLEELKHLTNNPSKTIEVALKQWLKGERAVDGDLTRTFRRNPPLPPRGEWND
ncbi:MAG: type II toxin-antitoxin system CcdA family antitoxin [Xenococcus sp. MO_188.B8]|nr:type II toxin-antitoxin system CcdA family antitoxin [Xenococcus sp. MO_188.B8]